MNTGFLGPAVATVLTVHGIETKERKPDSYNGFEWKLQQYLPFTVLKLFRSSIQCSSLFRVATVLTVHGIETHCHICEMCYKCIVARVLTVHGIETDFIPE